MSPRKHPGAVALGRLGGSANTPAQQAARAQNARHGRRPSLYRLHGDTLERYAHGRWLVLEPPYDPAARAFLRRQRT